MTNLEPNSTQWRLDRRLSLSALVTGLTSLILVVSLITTLTTRVEHLENKTNGLDTELRTVRHISITIGRMEERLDAMQQTLEELRGEMRYILRSKSSEIQYLPELKPYLPDDEFKKGLYKKQGLRRKEQ